MPPVHRSRSLHQRQSRGGQAIAEFTILLMVFLLLMIGVATLARLSLRQIRLRGEVRREAGVKALSRKTEGWVQSLPPPPETRTHPFHRINALAHLENYTPALTSHLPTSSYTLAARDLPEAELGLEETVRSERILLDEPFIKLIYGKGTLLLRQSVTFPATSGLWQ